METCTNMDFLRDYDGRMWIVGHDIYEFIFDNENHKIIEQKTFESPYQGDIFEITLVEKK